jgi:hypothetical protein
MYWPYVPCRKCDLHANLIAWLFRERLGVWATAAHTLVGDSTTGEIISLFALQRVARHHAEVGGKCAELVVLGAAAETGTSQ